MGKNHLDLLLDVYDGAIRGLQDASKHYHVGKVEPAEKSIQLTQRCLVHLYTTLDFDKGGEVAENLSKLYAFCQSQLDVILATRNDAMIKSLVNILTKLRAGWSELRENTKETAPAKSSNASEKFSASA